jgi:hypothetical protein
MDTMEMAFDVMVSNEWNSSIPYFS